MGNFIWTQESIAFTVRVVKYWNRLYKEVVEHPSSKILKTKLDTGLGNLLLLIPLEQV